MLVLPPRPTFFSNFKSFYGFVTRLKKVKDIIYQNQINNFSGINMHVINYIKLAKVVQSVWWEFHSAVFRKIETACGSE